jgi:chloramphenicol-sensitive protein RarD
MTTDTQTQPVKPQRTPANLGVIYAASAFAIWGIIPIYWKFLTHVGPVEIVMHRIMWTLIFALAALAAWQRLPKLWAALADRRSLGLLTISALLIATNWGIFIWAVTVDRIIETSLGYYINPLVNFVLGAAFLSERLTRIQLIAVGLATLGVLNQTISLGYLPWVSLVLALSFGVYGLIRKTVPVESLEGLTVESIILSPIAFGYVIFLTVTKQGAFLHTDFWTDFNLIIAGPLTAIPLLLFAAGARLVSLSTIGFLQYLAPSIALLIAVFMYNEPFTQTHAITFALIWSALALISWEALRRESYSAA